MDLDPESLRVRDRYGLLIAVIQPRPIAWISSLSPEGIPNLAPFSFFTGIAANPMSVCFAPVNDRNGRKKDTLINVETTRQFVINIANEETVEKMNLTAAAYPYGVSEFEKAGLTPLPSTSVKPPRVSESPVSMECELLQIVTLAEGPLGGNLVIGKVVRFHCKDEIWNGGRIRHQDLKTVGRLEGSWYARTRDDFELPRPEALS